MPMPERKPPVDPRTNPEFPGVMPVIDESEIIETIVSDIVVIGGGHGGTQCALAAAEKGASVSVVEKQRGDMKTWFGEQIGHFNSQFLIERGFGPYDEQEIVNEFMRLGSFRINHSLINKYVTNSGEMLDNMVKLVPEGNNILADDQCNVHQAYGNPKYPITVGGVKSWAGTLQFRGDIPRERHPEGTRLPSKYRLKEFEKFAMDRSIELGAKWYFQHSAVVLVKEDGAVRGVIAKNADGKYVKFLGTKGTLIAAGSVMGDIGTRLGVWAGGHLEFTPRESSMPSEGAKALGLTPLLTLNKNGKRFCNESNPYEVGAQIYRQPKGMVVSVTDKKWLESVKCAGLQHGTPDWGQPIFIEQLIEDMELTAQHKGPEGFQVRCLCLSEREYETMWCADSLEELAGYLGYEGEAKETFLSEIARYNELCYAGRDTDYGKDEAALIPVDEAPFFAGKSMNRRVNDLNPAIGLLTDDNMNVIDENDEPIPGLYVVGDCLGGFFGLYYATPCGGVHIGSAMTLGRVVGKYLADK